MKHRYKLSCAIACALSVGGLLAAGEDPAEKPAAASPEVEALRKMLLDQQRQIDELRRQLAGAPVHESSGEVASTSAIVPPVSRPAAPSSPSPSASSSPSPSAASSASPAAQGPENVSAPLSLKIGDAYVTPVGFMDMTLVSRSTNPGSGIGTNFGSIPYGNTQAGSLSETRLSIQNSRIGARVDASYRGAKILGYWESDFLGQLGNPPNGGLAVTSNPYVFRMRLYWVDVRKNKFEFLAGQTWSLMTPNRYGLSPLPGDLFYAQDIDVNYQLGLVWGRIPEYRFVFHPTEKVAFGVALSNSEPYVGGANGGSAIVAPACCSSLLGTQVNNGASVISAAAMAPDIIVKAAFDPSRKFHLEVAGVEIANKIANPSTTPAFQTFSNVGAGGSVNLNFALAKNLRVLTNNYWSDGGGRYIFGQAPDFVIRSNGALSNVHSGSTVSGLEVTAGKTLFYGYYGGVYIGKNLGLDANGKTPIGYGPISSDGQNRLIQEITFGTNTTIWRDAKWGALNFMLQYSYLQRNPWLAAAGAPTSAHADMGFFNFRYTLPGAPPNVEH